MSSTAGDTRWNITTSRNGDKLTAGPDDPGLVNFPGLNPPPAIGGQSISGNDTNSNGNSQNGAALVRVRVVGGMWWTVSLVLGGLGLVVAAA
jgi:hypothetical protein